MFYLCLELVTFTLFLVLLFDLVVHLLCFVRVFFVHLCSLCLCLILLVVFVSSLCIRNSSFCVFMLCFVISFSSLQLFLWFVLCFVICFVFSLFCFVVWLVVAREEEEGGKQEKGEK